MCSWCASCRGWASDHPAHFYKLYGEQQATKLYLLVYMGFVILFVNLLLVRDSTFSVWSVRAGTNLHNTLFRRVLAAPILFFLRTPVGDVLNAFARDQVRLCLSCQSCPIRIGNPVSRGVPKPLSASMVGLALQKTSTSPVTPTLHGFSLLVRTTVTTDNVVCLQDTLDETLPDTLHMTGIYLMILLTSLAIVTVSIYYYAAMAAALFLAFFMMQVRIGSCAADIS